MLGRGGGWMGGKVHPHRGNAEVMWPVIRLYWDIAPKEIKMIFLGPLLVEGGWEDSADKLLQKSSLNLPVLWLPILAHTLP